MGVRFPGGGTTANLGNYPASGAETIIFTTPPVSISIDFAPVFILWYYSLAVGAGTTSILVRIRRGAALTSLLINNAGVQAVTAATNTITAGLWVDTPGAVAAVQYSLSVSGTGTTGAAAFIDGGMLAFSL